MAAGPELSVAASKTFVADPRRAAAPDRRLDRRRPGSPRRSRACRTGSPTPARSTGARPADALGRHHRAWSTIGRGPTLAIAREASLKLKETCHLHAEAFSGAEFLHGPVALVSSRYPVLMFMPTDEAAAGMAGLAADLRQKGTALFTTEAGAAGGGRLPALAPDHPETDAVCLIQSFYAMLIGLAERLGADVDRPRHLQKVTRTR